MGALDFFRKDSTALSTEQLGLLTSWYRLDQWFHDYMPDCQVETRKRIKSILEKRLSLTSDELALVEGMKTLLHVMQPVRSDNASRMDDWDRFCAVMVRLVVYTVERQLNGESRLLKEKVLQLVHMFDPGKAKPHEVAA